MLDVCLSGVNNGMNDTMNALTIIATIFIPPSFLAGVYGMNFAHMPELGMEYVYPVLLLGMAAVGVVMALYFRAEKWI